MANRHLSRSIAMQTLFEVDFNNYDSKKAKEILERNLREFAPGLEDTSFTKKLVEGILKNKEKIDKIIEKVAPEWPLHQIAVVDRNVLRLGLFELLFEKKEEVPSRVAINEAIEIAKTFGSESSGRFVNGVLGTVFKEMGIEEEIEIPEEKLAGAVVYRLVPSKAEGKNDDFIFALVHDVFGYWTLSKGHLEGEETAEQGAVREIKEEIDLDIKIEKEIGENEYIASDPEKGKIKKIVKYFLASTSDKKLKLKESGGLDDANWFEMEELGDLKMYNDIRPIVAKAIKMLNKK
ncbi:transcription antitermination factor NusB [Patescibacteria group bacterium]|nr:transcription antitermination factor NusB [Patescibacteria group bacterium]MBU2219200.1 transcription antitermination factor NusB [Patescibacteria group bacterium]MBU2263150.1 transcription antitermination factor NusB [Patescibacteria group bacterium]